jgi:hypothetical protein
MLELRDIKFLEESNRIEGIRRPANKEEEAAFDEFMKLDKITVVDLEILVKAFQPDARLRTQVGMNVRVGRHFPPVGGMHILYRLEALLHAINQKEFTPYHAHLVYETLHPFLDGNGRSGRMIWWKMMGGDALGFLHRWYYQSLEHSGDRT